MGTHTYVCPLPLTVTLDSDMTDALIYTFPTEGLTGIKRRRKHKEGWHAVPTLRKTVRGKTPRLPLHTGLIHALGEAGAPAEASSSSPNGKAACRFCPKEIRLERMRLHVAGHILDQVGGHGVARKTFKQTSTQAFFYPGEHPTSSPVIPSFVRTPNPCRA